MNVRSWVPAGFVGPVAPIQAKVDKRTPGIELERTYTVEDAFTIALARDKGHNRVFTTRRLASVDLYTCTPVYEERVYIASHPAYVGERMFRDLGGDISEQKATKVKVLPPVSALTPEQKAELMAALLADAGK